MNAVVAGEVARGFARRDDVIRGDAVFGVGERDIDESSAPSSWYFAMACVDGGLDLRIDAGGEVVFFGDADAETFERFVEFAR